MNLRRLELFVVVAEELHFNRAAQRLHMAQPPLSQQIRKLEQEWKVQLFERNSRSVQLTTEGRVLLTYARKVLSQYDAMSLALQHARNGEAGRIRLGFVASAAISAIPLLVPHVKSRWPEIELALQEETTDAQIALIRDAALDVGIVRETGAAEGIQRTLLTDERLIAAVSSEHALAPHQAIPLSALQGEKFVTFPRHQVSRLFDHVSALLHSAGVTLDIAQEAVQFPTILALVAARVGVAIVPECLRTFAIPGVTYINLTDEAAVSQLSLIYRSDLADSALILKIRQAAIETIKR